MKFIYLFSFVILFYSISSAQITLTNTDFPVKGDTFRMSSAPLSTVLDLDSGANLVWDYSALTPNSQIVEGYNKMSDLGAFAGLLFGTFAPTKYQASYYNLNQDVPLQYLPSFLPITFSDYNNVYRSTSDSLSIVGVTIKIQGQNMAIKNSEIETQYYFPLNYGDEYTTHGKFDQDMNPIYDAKWKQKRTHKVKVDGWGKIKTPYGTFDALKIRHEIDEQDSLYVSMSGFSTWIPLNVPKQIVYEWRTNGKRNPILRIKANVVNGNEVVRSIQYRDSTVLLATHNLENLNKIVLYPNPAEDKIMISTDQFTKYEIYSNDGRLIDQGSIYNQTIDCSDLDEGTYYVQLKNDKNVYCGKFIKK